MTTASTSKLVLDVADDQVADKATMSSSMDAEAGPAAAAQGPSSASTSRSKRAREEEHEDATLLLDEAGPSSQPAHEAAMVNASKSREVSPSQSDASISDSTSGLQASDRRGSTFAGSEQKRRMPLNVLPSEIETTIRSALMESRAASVPEVPAARNDSMTHSPSRGFLQHMERCRQQRALSMPDHSRNVRRPSAFPMPPAESDQARRGSVRAQQLALLASQARLASSGTDNVGKAMRSEDAIKSAIMSHAEDAGARHRHSLAPHLLSIKEGRGEDEDAEQSSDADSEEDDEGDRNSERTATARRASKATMSMTPSESVAAWSATLGSPAASSSFLESASEVARSWANGFYAFEKEWVGDALERERRRSSAVGPTDVGERAGAPPRLHRTPTDHSMDESPLATPDETTDESAVRLKRNSSSASDASMSYPRSMAPLLAAQKRLSSAREESRQSLSGLAGRMSTLAAAPSDDATVTPPSGRLLDVLSNFATLIESRTEGCHGLERLAQDAQMLSAVPLPAPLARESLGTMGVPTPMSSASPVSAGLSDSSASSA